MANDPWGKTGKNYPATPVNVLSIFGLLLAGVGTGISLIYLPKHLWIPVGMSGALTLYLAWIAAGKLTKPDSKPPDDPPATNPDDDADVPPSNQV